MIDMLSTAITVPKAGREIIARNPLKPIGYNSSAKQCRVMKFPHSFDEDMIRDVMLGDNLTLWVYVEGSHDED